MEIWKDVNGYEGIYQISTKGRVRNIKYDRLLRQAKHRTGYVSVMLYRNGNPKRINIHRLVAENFIEKPDGCDIVNHKDENKSNNNIENLEWCSGEYNMKYGTLGKRITQKRGHCARKKRKVIQMDGCGNTLHIWDSISTASKETGTARTSIFECCIGIHKTANGYVWKYEV